MKMSRHPKHSSLTLEKKEGKKKKTQFLAGVNL